jgi:GTP cyclohydrolase I
LKNGRVAETEVIDIQKHKTHDVVIVKTEKGTFRVTEDHPLATKDTGWIEAQNTEGLLIEWVQPRALCRDVWRPVPGYSLGYAIGAIFSDGSTWKNRYVALNVTSKFFAQTYRRHLLAAFPGMTARVHKTKVLSGFRKEYVDSYQVRVCSSYFAELVRSWAGGDTHHMRQKFPYVVLQSQDMFQGFIDGYTDGDGSREKVGDTGSTIVSGNKPFLEEFAKAIQSRSQGGHKATNAWALYIPDRWADKGGGRQGFYKKHGFVPESHHSDLIESQYVRVLSVTRPPKGAKPSTVYSFTCTEPTFLISGHLTHNCSHHMLPFTGEAYVGYLPGDFLVGASKLARTIDFFSKKLQLQERLGRQAADFLHKQAKARFTAVLLHATHSCMSCRGVRQNAKFVTAAIRPHDETLRGLIDEFYHHVSLIQHARDF